MGSPWHACTLSFRGEWTPGLPTADWQDQIAQRPDGKVVALARWDAGGNVPGFRLVVVDTVRRRIHRSHRIAGCCQGLVWRSATRVGWRSSSGRQGTWTFRSPARG